MTNVWYFQWRCHTNFRNFYKIQCI